MNAGRLQIPAVILGMSGAVAVAEGSECFRALGFTAWIVANTLWVLYGMQTKNRGILLLFAFYALTSAWGLAHETSLLG